MKSTINLKALLFFYFSAMTIITSYLPIYFQESGLTGRQIGFLLAVGPFAAMIFQPFWGFLIDKYKTAKKILILCIIGAICASLFLFQSLPYYLLIFAVFIFYTFLAPVGGVSDSLAQKTANRLSITFGSIRLWGSLGFAIMSLLSGFLFARIGVEYIYLPFILFCLVTLIFAFRVNDTETSTKKSIHLKETIKLIKNKHYIFFLFIMLFITITHRTNDHFLGIYIVDKGGTESFIGWAWFIGVISETFIFATASYWFRKYHPLTFIIFSGVFFAIRWFIMGMIQNPILVLPLQVMHGLTFGVFYLCAFHFITKLVPKELQSTGHLLFYSIFFGFSGMIGASIGGLIIDNISVTYLYLLISIVSFTGAVFMAVYKQVFFHPRNHQLL